MLAARRRVRRSRRDVRRCRRDAADAAPGDDLADAKDGAPPRRRGDVDLVAKDPRIVDLDIIRITATSRRRRRRPRAGSRRDRRSVPAGERGREGRRDRATRSRCYRQLVTEFPESQYAPVSLFNIAAIYDGQRRSRRDDRDAPRAGRRPTRARASRSTATSTSRRCRPTTSSAPTRSPTLDAVARRAPNLTYADRVEALARKGYVLIELQPLRRRPTPRSTPRSPSGARRRASRTRTTSRWRHYYRGELAHRKFTEAPVRLPDDVADRRPRGQARARRRRPTTAGRRASASSRRTGRPRRAIRCRRSSSSCGRRTSRRRIPSGIDAGDARRSTSPRSTSASASTSRRRSRAIG